MKRLVLALSLVCAPSMVLANDWDLVTQIGSISVYFDRDSVKPDPSRAGYKQGDLVFLLSEKQTVQENDRTISLDYFRFGHTYNCAEKPQSEIVRLEGGLTANPDQVEHVANPRLSSKHSEFDDLRWDLVCGAPLTSKPTYRGSLQQLARQRNKHDVRAPHTKTAQWSVARNTGRQLDLLNHDTIKKLSNNQYYVEFYNIKSGSTSDYSVYRGVLNCAERKYLLQTSDAFNIHQEKQVGGLRFDFLPDKSRWSLNIQNDEARLDKTLLSICNNTLEGPQFSSTIVEALNSQQEDGAANLKIHGVLQDTRDFTPFEFQNR